jgi:hypothetical protein
VSIIQIILELLSLVPSTIGEVESAVNTVTGGGTNIAKAMAAAQTAAQIVQTIANVTGTAPAIAPTVATSVQPTA